jgi:hypothetical protein
MATYNNKTVTILKTISSVLCFLYIVNFIALLASIVNDPNSFLHTDLASLEETTNGQQQPYAIILIIVAIILFLCDLLMCDNALRKPVWFVQSHTSMWLLLCFGKICSLFIFSAMFGQFYLLDSLASVTSSPFVYANICLVNGIIHLLLFVTVSFIISSKSADGETLIGEVSRHIQHSPHLQTVSILTLRPRVESYQEFRRDEQLPPSYTDIDLNWALPTFDEAVNFDKTHIWTTDKASIA